MIFDRSVISRRRLLALGSSGVVLASAMPGALLAAGGQEPPVPMPALPNPGVVTTMTAAGGREVSVTQWLPTGEIRGTILFSHGAGSSPAYYDLFIAPWVHAGWRVLAPLHVDSREHPDVDAFKGLAGWKARIEDMQALIGMIGDTPFVAAGHSYGGLVALTLGGSIPVPPEGLSLPLVPRIAKAVIAFSPPPPIPVLVTQEGYGKLAVPAFIQTGTRDLPPGAPAQDGEGWKGHLAPYEAAAPGGHRYGLVLEGANHYFGGAICDFSQPGPAQLAQADLASRYAGLFLEAFGGDDTASRALLDARVSEALPARLMSR